jgi:hypothetical protein
MRILVGVGFEYLEFIVLINSMLFAEVRHCSM